MFGYAKIFQQIFDSSIADDWQVRHVFEDLLILANSDGVVDMTHDAISRRTNTPLEIVTRAIAELEKPDPKSRSELEGGARLKRLDDHRNWGWWIVNHNHYRDMTTDEQYRAKSRERMRRFRENAKKTDDVTQRNATVTHVTPSRSSKQIADTEAKTPKQRGAHAPVVVIVEKDFPDNLRSARMVEKWACWQNVRRGMKKPKCWMTLFNEQVEWLSQFDEPKAFEALSASIRNGWQGLFEPKAPQRPAGNNFSNGAPISETVGATIEETILKQTIRSVMKGVKA